MQGFRSLCQETCYTWQGFSLGLMYLLIDKSKVVDFMRNE